MESKQISLMAYCPLDQGHLLQHPVLGKLSEQYDAKPAQIALSWLLQQGVIAIPKSMHIDRVKENIDSQKVHLDKDDLSLLDHVFPKPVNVGESCLQMR